MSKCCELSNGKVNLIHPLELTRQMRMILDNPVIAIDVNLSVYLPPGIKVRNAIGIVNERNVLESNIGNISTTSNYTLDFGIDKEEYSQVSNYQNVPIQVQIKYSKNDGSEYLRVETFFSDISSDRSEVESGCDTATIGLHAVKTAANLAISNVTKARDTLQSYQKLFDRTVTEGDKMDEYTCFLSQSEELDRAIRQIARSGSASGEIVKTLYNLKNLDKSKFLASERKKSIIEKRKKHAGEAKQMSNVHDSNQTPKAQESNPTPKVPESDSTPKAKEESPKGSMTSRKSKYNTEDDWIKALNGSGLSESRIQEYAKVFCEKKIRLKDKNSFDHDYLLNIGITIAKDRMKLIKWTQK
jgi:hypothetical protein